jgi:hypothetical protein
MSDIKSELERLVAATPLDQPEVYDVICRSYSTRTIARAIGQMLAAPAKRRTPVDRAGREIKPGVAVKDRKKPKGV